MKTVKLTADANGRVHALGVGGYVWILQALSAGDNLDVTWLDAGGQERGTVLDIATGQRLRPGFLFAGFDITGASAGAAVYVLIGDNPDADADLLDAVTVENPSSSPVQVEIVEPVELTATAVELEAGGGVVDASNPLPVREILPTAIVLASVAVDDTIDAVLALSATRRGFLARNAGDNAAALVPAAGTYAGAAIVLLPGETYRETDAPGAAWYAICDAGLSTTLKVQTW